MKKSKLLLILGLGLIACTPNTSYNKPSESQNIITQPSSDSNIESSNSTNKDSLVSSLNNETSGQNTSATSEDSSQESSSSSSTTTSESGLDINSQTTIDSGVWEPPVIVC